MTFYENIAKTALKFFAKKHFLKQKQKYNVTENQQIELNHW